MKSGSRAIVRAMDGVRRAWRFRRAEQMGGLAPIRVDQETKTGHQRTTDVSDQDTSMGENSQKNN